MGVFQAACLLSGTLIDLSRDRRQDLVRYSRQGPAKRLYDGYEYQLLTNFDSRSPKPGWQKRCDLKKCDSIPPRQSLLLSQRPNGGRISRQNPEEGSATGMAHKVTYPATATDVSSFGIGLLDLGAAQN